jgi:ABC-type nitrate/sulfonate/bicarbonate transport system substrate-binding protein
MVNSFPLVRRLLAILSVLALLAAGCGSDSSSSGGVKTVDVALDFVPNAVHAPLYEAVRTGADRKHGIKIHIVEPGSSPDSLKALLTGATSRARPSASRACRATRRSSMRSCATTAATRARSSR